MEKDCVLSIEIVHVTSRMRSDDVTGVKKRGNAIEKLIARLGGHLGSSYCLSGVFCS